MKKVIKGYVQAYKYEWDREPTFFISTEKLGSYVTVCAIDVEFDLPENFSMTPGLIDVLNAKKEAATVEFHKAIAAINDQITSLQCLEMS